VKIFDIIVVGFGLAGSSTAYQLVRRGHRVLALGKESMPRYKPCGGCLSREGAFAEVLYSGRRWCAVPATGVLAA